MSRKTERLELQRQVDEHPVLLTDPELLSLAEKHNSGGRFGNLKEIHAALLQYNKFLKGEISKSEL